MDKNKKAAAPAGHQIRLSAAVFLLIRFIRRFNGDTGGDTGTVLVSLFYVNSGAFRTVPCCIFPCQAVLLRHVVAGGTK